MVTEKQLQRIYAKVNRLGFGGRLPKARIYFVKYRTLNGNLGDSDFNVTGRRVSDVRIRLNASIRWSEILCGDVIIHEMTHVATRSSAHKRKPFYKTWRKILRHRYIQLFY